MSYITKNIELEYPVYVYMYVEDCPTNVPNEIHVPYNFKGVGTDGRYCHNIYCADCPVRQACNNDDIFMQLSDFPELLNYPELQL